MGYRFEAGKRFVRKKSLKSFRDKVRAKTKRSRSGSINEIIADLNPMLREGVGLNISNMLIRPHLIQMMVLSEDG